jgi:sphingolipid delta-4 desaturase
MAPREDFVYVNTDEPHSVRRKQILEKYPEIEKLFGYDMRPAPFVVAIVASQLALAYYQQFWSFPVVFLVAWIYGGAASHSLSLMTHEISHNLVLPTPSMNELFGIFCNCGMGIPSSTVFKKYHMEHHQFQGDREYDQDIPRPWEGKVFRGTFMKLLWLIMQPLFYALRPSIYRPKPYRPMDIVNLVLILSMDAVIAMNWGPRAVVYLVMSTLLGMGLHPVAGHFIAEHYVFEGSNETYSYYGPLNYLCWNVGYHNEHHDFPRVPGFRLPLVKQMAPEFYENVPQHKSWVNVLWRYVVELLFSVGFLVCK